MARALFVILAAFQNDRVHITRLCSFIIYSPTIPIRQACELWFVRVVWLLWPGRPTFLCQTVARTQSSPTTYGQSCVCFRVSIIFTFLSKNWSARCGHDGIRLFAPRFQQSHIYGRIEAIGGRSSRSKVCLRRCIPFLHTNNVSECERNVRQLLCVNELITCFVKTTHIIFNFDFLSYVCVDLKIQQ